MKTLEKDIYRPFRKARAEVKQCATGRALCQNGSWTANSRNFEKNSPNSSVTTATYSKPVADCVCRICTVLWIITASTIGATIPNSIRGQKNIP